MKLPHSIRMCLAALAAISGFSLHAEEGGVGHYVPGSVATLIDLPPAKPGWVVEPMYLYYQGDASAQRTLPFAGLLAAGIEAESGAFTLGVLYTFDPTVLGAHYSAGIFAPYVWMDVSATLSTPRGTLRRTDSADGFGDLTIIPLMMAWKQDDWQLDLTLPVYAPTGDYDVGRLANPGLNRWTFDPTVGLSYNGAKNGFNAAVHTGFAFNTENDETDYTSGTVWHLDASVQQLMPLGKGFLGIGANAFVYEQFTGDCGSGARLGDFQGRTIGVGPALSYVLPVGDNTFAAEIRWLPELETKNRLEGDYLWLKLVYQF